MESKAPGRSLRVVYGSFPKRGFPVYSFPTQWIQRGEPFVPWDGSDGYLLMRAQAVLTQRNPNLAPRIKEARGISPWPCSFGSPSRTRTYNLVVNSHPLCRLSYRGTYPITLRKSPADPPGLNPTGKNMEEPSRETSIVWFYTKKSNSCKGWPEIPLEKGDGLRGGCS